MYKKMNNDEDPHFFMFKNGSATTSVATLKNDLGGEMRFFVDDKFYRIAVKKIDGYFTITNLPGISPEIHNVLKDLPPLDKNENSGYEQARD